MVKNTLTKRAASDAGLASEFDALLSGPSAIAFVKGDVVEAAKGLRDFSRNNPLLVIKGGVLDGKAISPAEIERLADLESREVLLAKLAGDMKASMAKAAAVFNALPVADGPAGRGVAGQAGGRGRRHAPAADDAAPDAPQADAAQARHGSGGPAAADPAAEAPAAEAPQPTPPATTSPRPAASGPARTTHTRKRKTAPWRRSAPTTCSTRSRR